MNRYEQIAFSEMKRWQFNMQRPPGIFNRLSKRTQDKINALIPEKVHKGITVVIKQMIHAVLFGAKHTTAKPLKNAALILREQTVKEKIKFYRSAAAVEGGITGAGGFFMALADFPLLLALKLKLLYEIASVYGIDLEDYRERVYLLHIFELAFSSSQHRNEVYRKIEDWNVKMQAMPADVSEFDWRRFQQEYRDYIDLAKMAQLLPVVGAPVGFIANYQLVKKLGTTAMNAYRMRLLTTQL
ncbi:EcsC family protein [Niabella beijingensis]|uniref:EcsC family protein n=1 Tax=Niabella beijingensis TaxID=2872700 RepID=UPI001CC143EF|nr:EcsC family protein [Niabella beijingensis]MBZ4192318.1 EcsC family protein [Niabella beijingensis]